MILKYYCSLAKKVILLFTFCLNEKQNKNWNVVRVNITVVVFLCSVCNEVLSYLIHFNVISMFFYIFTSCHCYDYCCCSCCFHVKNKATYSHFLKILNEDNFDFRFSFHVQLYFFLPFNSFWKLLALKSLLPSILTRLYVLCSMYNKWTFITHIWVYVLPPVIEFLAFE